MSSPTINNRVSQSRRLLFNMFLTLCLTACSSGITTFHSDDIRIHRLSKKFTNIYVVETTVGNLLVDTGYSGTSASIKSQLALLGITLDSLRGIILTHSHADHAGSALQLQNILEDRELPIFIGEGDSIDLGQGISRTKCPRYWYSKYLSTAVNRNSYDAVAKKVEIPHRVRLSSILSDPELLGDLVSIPGHTDGSIVLVIGSFAIVGDAIMGGVFSDRARDPLFLCNRENYKELLEERLLDAYPEIEVFLPGHLGAVSREAFRRYVEDER